MKLKDMEKKSTEIILENQFESGLFPASPKGTRYWPHSYPRDSVMISRALDKNGLHKEAKKCYLALLKLQCPKGGLYQRYDGRSGKQTSYKKAQTDSNGLVLWGIWNHYNHTEDRDFLKQTLEPVRNFVKFIKSHDNSDLIKTGCSVHEYPKIEKGKEIWVNVTCLAGIESASKIAEILNIEEGAKWKKYAQNLRKNILDSFLKNEIFIKRIKPELIGPDISGISPFLFDVLPAKDGRVTNTADKIMKPVPEGLKDEKMFNGICRYPEKWGRHNGGFGPWVRDTCWMSGYFSTLGKNKKAKKMLKSILNFSDKNGNLPEHISTIKRLIRYLRERFEEHGQEKLVEKLKAAGEDKDKIKNLVKKSKMKKSRKAMVFNEFENLERDGILRAVPGLLQSHGEFLWALKMNKVGI